AVRPARCGSCPSGWSRSARPAAPRSTWPRRPPRTAPRRAAAGPAAAARAGSQRPLLALGGAVAGAIKGHDVEVKAGRLAQEAQQDRAPQHHRPPRLSRAADNDMADVVRAREVENAGHLVPPLEAHHLGAQLARQLDVVEQVALRLGVYTV